MQEILAEVVLHLKEELPALVVSLEGFLLLRSPCLLHLLVAMRNDHVDFILQVLDLFLCLIQELLHSLLSIP